MINYCPPFDQSTEHFQESYIKVFIYILFLQIVPPNQAEMMYKAVKEKGIPCMYVLFEGRQREKIV